MWYLGRWPNDNELGVIKRVIKKNDTLAHVDVKGALYEGSIIHVGTETFWLYVHESQIIYEGHPKQVIELDGLNRLVAEDRSIDIEQKIQQWRKYGDDTFDCLNVPEEVIKQIKTYALIMNK